MLRSLVCFGGTLRIVFMVGTHVYHKLDAGVYSAALTVVYKSKLSSL